MQLQVISADPAIRHSLAFMFGADGYDVIVGEQLTPRKTADSLARCVVIDDAQPGASGLELLRAMRERGETTAVVLMASDPSPRFLETANDLKAEVVEKPLQGDVMGRAVELSMILPGVAI